MKKGSWCILVLILCTFFTINVAGSKQPRPVKSIKSEDGDMIDCISLYEQPALKNPLIRNRKTIQMRPGNLPSTGRTNTISSAVARQAWGKNGRCPNGTIPIRRDTEEFPAAMEAAEKTNNCQIEFAGIQALQTVFGAKGDVNVWGIRVESREWSTSGITISNGQGSFIQFGWMVSPTLYGDAGKTRLFIRTVDRSGLDCFNLRCAGFVQISNEFAFGAALAPLSQYGDAQYEIPLAIYKDNSARNWWAMYGNTPLGYWPVEILSFFESGQAAFWGGQICNMHQGLQITTTRMGSGYHPTEGWGKSAYVHGMEVMGNEGTWHRPQRTFINSSMPTCYGVDTYHSKDGKLSAFFGGTASNICCGLDCQ